MHRSGMTLRLLPVALLAACSNTPHNNVLLFGTDTKVALDISSAATQGGAPQITLGYRRSEAVWMPLVVNKVDCPAGTGNASDCRVTSDAAESSKFKGQNGQSTDAYSVFASFGAKFSGGASATEVNASGGLAQFFATGIAAQKLAANPGMENALRINSPGAAEGEAAEAKAIARAKELDVELGKQKTEELKALADQRRTLESAETTIILNRCSGPAKDKAAWDAMLAKAADPAVGLPPDGKFVLENTTTDEAARKNLELQRRYRNPIFKNLDTLCPT